MVAASGPTWLGSLPSRAQRLPEAARARPAWEQRETAASVNSFAGWASAAVPGHVAVSTGAAGEAGRSRDVARHIASRPADARLPITSGRDQRPRAEPGARRRVSSRARCAQRALPRDRLRSHARRRKRAAIGGSKAIGRRRRRSVSGCRLQRDGRQFARHYGASSATKASSGSSPAPAMTSSSIPSDSTLVSQRICRRLRRTLCSSRIARSGLGGERRHQRARQRFRVDTGSDGASRTDSADRGARPPKNHS